MLLCSVDDYDQKKGRGLNAPLTQGTAKRPSREARQAAPDGRVLAAGPLDLKFAVSERGRSRSYAKFLLNSFTSSFFHAAIADANKKLEEIRRFDMPGFRPRPEWVREMKRFGILPATFSERDPVDVYSVEKRYWESLWPRPVASGPQAMND